MNTNYKKIKDLGLDLEIKANRNGWNKAYLVKNNKRLVSVFFRRNWGGSDSVENFVNCREFGHKNEAMLELLEGLK